MTKAYGLYIQVLEVIEMVGQGSTLTRACDDACVTVFTFNKYVKNDVNLQSLLADAVQRGNDALADALLQPDNHLLYGRTDSKMAAVMSKNIMWVLSKRDSRFADRVEHKVTLTADTAITSALEMARTRINKRAPVLIDVTPSTPSPLTSDEEEELAVMLGL